MRWLALWLLLILTYAAGWALTQLAVGDLLILDRESLAHFAAIPLVQLLALAALRVYRKPRRRKPGE
jgi:hypothetical protein